MPHFAEPPADAPSNPWAGGSPEPIRLGVNIDHVATLRQARRTNEPDPAQAVFLAEEAGADGITMHLREDRRHVQERDVEIARSVLRTRLNLECSLSPDMIAFAFRLAPEQVCLVPERREEITTEGGLDVAARAESARAAVARLSEAGVEASLFIDPDERQLEAAVRAGAPAIELHTGHYAQAWRNPSARAAAWAVLERAARKAREMGLQVHAGHGLTYHNVAAIARIPCIAELNIGHSIISRAVMTGLAEAVREMKRVMREARTCA